MCWLAIYDAAIVTWHCLGLSSWPAVPFSDEETDRNHRTGQAWLGFLGSHILNQPRTICTFSTLSAQEKGKKRKNLIVTCYCLIQKSQQNWEPGLGGRMFALAQEAQPRTKQLWCSLLQSPAVTKASSQSAGLHVPQIMTTVSQYLNM